MFSSSQSKRRSTSESGVSKTSKHKSKARVALSIDTRSDRIPVINMETIDDVPTLACVEISKAILKRPEVNTGSLFKTIAASRSVTNKSDAVITITAAILKTIGNDKASESILSKSRTVSEFYKSMRLDNDDMRTSFVIMLFALAPEFVKMIESSVVASMKRVQEQTEAPLAEAKLLMAMGELARSESLTSQEFSEFLKDNKMSNLETSARPSSIQLTPSEMIMPDDSISVVRSPKLQQSDSPMTSIGLMRYIKRNPGAIDDKFYKEFPNARKPVILSSNNNKDGLGYKQPESAVMDNISESNFTSAMNNLLPDNRSLRRKRYVLTEDDKAMFRRPRVDSATESDSTETFKDAFEHPVNELTSRLYNVTVDDIKNDVKDKNSTQLGYSPPITSLSSEESHLLSLL